MTVIRRMIGILLILAAIIGLVFSIGGIIVFRQVEPNLTAGIQNTIDLLSSTLETTAQGLVVTNAALESTVQTISALEQTVQTIATTVKSSTPMVGEISKLLENELPSTINATETSLRSAQESAQVIDSLLGTLSSLPLIGASLNYDPNLPLSDALGNVASSLEDLPESLAGMQTSLADTTSNLETFEADLSVMASSIGEIENSVSQYTAVLEGYLTSIKGLQIQMKALKTNIPTYIHYMVLGITVFFVWMAIAQLGLMTQGWELLTENRAKRKELEDTAEAPKAQETEEMQAGA